MYCGDVRKTAVTQLGNTAIIILILVRRLQEAICENIEDIHQKTLTLIWDTVLVCSPPGSSSLSSSSSFTLTPINQAPLIGVAGPAGNYLNVTQRLISPPTPPHPFCFHPTRCIVGLICLEMMKEPL